MHSSYNYDNNDFNGDCNNKSYDNDINEKDNINDNSSNNNSNNSDKNVNDNNNNNNINQNNNNSSDISTNNNSNKSHNLIRLWRLQATREEQQLSRFLSLFSPPETPTFPRTVKRMGLYAGGGHLDA